MLEDSRTSAERVPKAIARRAVLFYVTDDHHAGEEVERFIRTAGFVPVNAGKLDQSGRLEVGGDLHDLVVDFAEARSLTGGA